MAVEIQVQEEGGEPRSDEVKRDPGRTYLYYLGLVVVVIGFASCLMQLQFHDENCSVDINDGSWVQGQWHSHHCLMHYFDSSEVQFCLAKRPHVALIGGADIQYYHQRLGEVQVEVQQSDLHSKINIERLGEPNGETTTLYKKLATDLDSSPPLLILHKLKQAQLGGDDDGDKCKSEIKQLMMVQEGLVKAGNVKSVEVAPLVVTLLSDLSESCLEFAQQLYANSSLAFVGLPLSAVEEPSDFLSHELNMVLNLFCNSPANATCCLPALTGSLSSYVDMDASFLLLILAVYLGIWLVFASGATFALSPYLEAMSCNLEKFFSILHCVGGTCTVLFYMLLADRLDYFTRVNKFSNPLLFVITLVPVIIASAATLTKRKKKEYLTADQVSEWRGWMIIVIIAINYTDMDKVVWIHLIGQLMVGGFLFLSGYTHFMYFWTAGGVSWKRVLYVLLDINFIPLCVCLSLGSSYGAYYLIPLLTVNFLFTAAFVAVWPSVSNVKQNQLGSPIIIMAIKFVVAFIFISYLLPLAKEPLASTPLRMFLQSFDDCPYALYHWFYQLRYMTLLGMVVAVVITQLRGEYSALATRFEYSLTIKAIVFTVIVILGYAVFLGKCTDKDSCTRSHVYIAVFPLLAYLYLRNSIKHFQKYYSWFLSQAGSLSVWLFVSHFHLLLARDGKGLLMLIPRFYYLNLAAVVTVYVFFFIVVHKSMMTLKAWLQESKTRAADSSLTV